MYCGGNSCIAPTRICKNCGNEFARITGGTRYCSDDCREKWYRSRPSAAELVDCPVCATTHSGTNPWQICPEHWSAIFPISGALRRHHVPTHMVVALIKHPFCPIDGCGRALLEHDRTRGRINLAVDHDHTLGCHPGQHGCELCVRGLICWVCNVALHKDDRPRLHRGRATYLEAWERRGDYEPDVITPHPPPDGDPGGW